MVNALSDSNSRCQLEITDSLSALRTQLETSQTDETVTVLIANDAETMLHLAQLQGELDGQRLVFVLDTSNRAMVEDAHRFYPRVVADIDDSADIVPKILRRIQHATDTLPTGKRPKGDLTCQQQNA